MKVSVVVPIYNVSAYIRRALLSVLDQSWPELEIILVNDCTPDDSMSLVGDILDRHPRSPLVSVLSHDCNKGLSAARNTGIAAATGEYIYFMDSDDYLPPQAIETLARAAGTFHPDFVIGNYEVTGAKRGTPPLKLDTGLLPTNRAVLSAYANEEWFVMAWNKLVRLSFLRKERLFFKEGIVHEDDLWSFKLACTASSAYVVNQTTYYYYIQPDSITGKPSMRNLECRVRIIEYLLDYINESEYRKENKYVYLIFETLKAKYFDKMIQLSVDRAFCYSSYLVFRKSVYLSPFKALLKWRMGMGLTCRNFHYLLGEKAGYIYFRAFVKSAYILKVLPAKIRQWTHR